MTCTPSALSKFVLNFIAEQGDSDIATAWSSKDQQTAIKKFLAGNKKKEKDENAPKRSKTGYIFFCNANRDKVKRENPDMDNKKITSLLATMWNDLRESGSKELDHFNRLAEEDRERYEKAKAEYQPSEGFEKKKKSGPTRGKSSYLFFCEKMRPVIAQSNPDMQNREIVAEMGVQWANLKEDPSRKDELDMYTDLALADKERYERAKADSTQDLEDEEHSSIKNKSNKKESKQDSKKESKKDSKKDSKKESKEDSKKDIKKAPKKGAKSGFDLFSEENRSLVKEDMPQLTSKEVTKKLKKLWNQETDYEQEKYEKRAADY